MVLKYVVQNWNLIHSIRRLRVKNFMCWAPLIEGEFGHTHEAWY